jgi:putative MATE family efflux protein
MEARNHNTNEINGMFEGPILPLALRLSIPFLISNMIGLLYLVIDTYFITRIDPGSTALISGTGLVFPVYFLFLALGMGINIGVSSLVARAIGEKNQTALERAADSGLLIAIILAVAALTPGYIFGNDILHFLAGSRLTEEAIGHGLRFFYSILPALGLLLLGHVLLGVLQGEGLTRYIATASVISAVVNIALDPLLIFYFGLGVAGAGLATSLGIAAAAVYVIGIFAKKKSSIPIHWNIARARARLMLEILRVGSVQSLQMAAMSVTFMFLNNIVSSIGQDAMNSWALCGRTDQILFIPAFAVSGATISMVGQNYGRGNLSRVRRIYAGNILLGLGMVLFLAIVYNIAAEWIFAGFSSVPGVIRGSVSQVRALSFTFVGVSTAMISGSTFQATGKPLPALVITLIRMIVLTVPAAYLLVYVFDMKMPGVFISLGAGNALALPLSWAWTNLHLKRLKVRSVGG